MGNPDAELSILICDDEQIAKLNSVHRNKQGPTNVIAFPMQEGDFAAVTPYLLGDVVISIDTALKEAKDFGITLEKRFIELLIHGTLHLMGYDHEKGAKYEIEMHAKSDELLKLIESTENSSFIE